MVPAINVLCLLTFLCLIQQSNSWIVTSGIKRIKPCRHSSVARPFGEQEFWQAFYQDSDSAFSWYSGYDDLSPFLKQVLWSNNNNTATAAKVLVAGVGSDVELLQGLHRDGLVPLYGFDYAEASIHYLQDKIPSTIQLCTADIRDLPYETATFDAVLDKGTLDAVYIHDEEALEAAVHELQRVLQPGGFLMSLSGICTDALRQATMEDWTSVTDGSTLHSTDDGYTSNNLDGTWMVFEKPSNC